MKLNAMYRFAHVTLFHLRINQGMSIDDLLAMINAKLIARHENPISIVDSLQLEFCGAGDWERLCDVVSECFNVSPEVFKHPI